jgi:cell division septation protein DedD
MADSRRETGESRYYLSRRQLILVALGFSISSAIVFVLGILVGQKVEERKLLKDSTPMVKIPIQPGPRGLADRTPAKEEMTFYDTLAKAPSGKSTPKKPIKEAQPAGGASVQKPRAKEEISSPLGNVDEKAKTEAKPAQWTVQVNAFPTERDANGLAKKLADRGYDAYVVPVDIKGRTWYRVRVGRFAKREEAQELQETLKTKEKLTKAISVSR